MKMKFNNFMHQKKGTNLKIVSYAFLLIGAIVFGVMLFNVGERFINDTSVYSLYYLMDGVYLMQTLMLSPSLAFIEYPQEMSRFSFEIENNELNVLVDDLKWDSYKMDFDQTVKYNFERGTIIENYYIRDHQISFSNEKPITYKFICPYVEINYLNPKLLLAVYPNDNKEFDDYLKKFYFELNEKRSNVEIFNLHIDEDEILNYDFDNYDLSISLSTREFEPDVVIYFKPSEKNSRFACLYANHLDIEGLKFVVLPSEQILTDIKIEYKLPIKNDVKILLDFYKSVNYFFN